MIILVFLGGGCSSGGGSEPTDPGGDPGP